MEVDHTGLHHRPPVRNVHREDAIHSGKADEDTLFRRERPPAEARPSAPGHKRNIHPGSQLDDLNHFFCRGREDYRNRKGSINGEGVALIDQNLLLLREDMLSAQDGPKALDQLLLTGVHGFSAAQEG